MGHPSPGGSGFVGRTIRVAEVFGTGSFCRVPFCSHKCPYTANLAHNELQNIENDGESLVKLFSHFQSISIKYQTFWYFTAPWGIAPIQEVGGSISLFLQLLFIDFIG